ncbi:hypothetical protein ASPTUDRAFT_55791 [Aspergillus tubingensis CBS 134.48]|uniref:Uncharacterized protein n=1 Tax=Aspergillus tubingensis (strain CBS 134.48) TaxID=767770 RepID=A0A1L9N3H2_ASPTC|nr:hypothetical protein ASPTUDRAFT_55791 [Aspergillus tubingensis CBS 134.48]
MITVSRLLVPTAIQAPPPTPPPPLPPPAHTGARLLHNLDLLPAGIVSSGRIRGFPAAVRNQASPDGADPPRKPVASCQAPGRSRGEGGGEDHPLHSGRVWGITHTGRSPTERRAQQDLVVSDEDHPMQMCTVLAFLDPPASMLEFKKSAARDGMDGCPTDPEALITKFA